jgi:hypothetical protein
MLNYVTRNLIEIYKERFQNDKSYLDAEGVTLPLFLLLKPRIPKEKSALSLVANGKAPR